MFLSAREEWFLMDCLLPKLQWALLRVADDGTALILTPGRRLEFATEDAARSWMAEDEYQDLRTILTSGDYVLPPVVEPPSASTDTELQARMAAAART